MCQQSCRRPLVKQETFLQFNRALADFEASPLAASDANNETGGLAWGQGYAMLALLRMYQATRRPEYLEKVAQTGEQIFAQTDRARRVTDYQGRSGPVWRAGSKYTVSKTTLDSPGGVPIVEVRYAGHQSDEATVTVTPGSTPETFTLLLYGPGTTPVRVNNVSTSREDTRNVEATVLREAYRPAVPWTASVLAGGLPGPGVRQLEAGYNVFVVHTGMITYPLALYARTVLQDPKLFRSQQRQYAERFLDRVRSAVAFHDLEWSTLSNSVAGYLSIKGSPVSRDGNFLPINQSNAMGRTLAELFRITGDRRYAERVENLASAWRASLRPQPGGGAAWSYWPPFSKAYTGYTAADQVSIYTPDIPPGHTLDDLGHSGITAEFAIAAHGAGIGVSSHDLAVLRQTYLRQLRSGPKSIRTRFGGPIANPSVAARCATWLGLGSSSIAQHAQAVTDSADPTSTTKLLGCGYLAWAEANGLL